MTGNRAKKFSTLLCILLASAFLEKPGAQGQTTIARMSPADAQVASEVSIAINPANLNNIVAGSLVRGVPDSDAPNMSYYTFDGGKTWNQIAVPNPDNRTQGDDVLLFHRDGTALHAFITFVGLWEENPERASNGIALVRSRDGGVSWTEKQSLVADHVNTKTPMEDKPWLVFDRSRRSPHFGNLYCTWTRFDVYGSENPQDTTQIMFARSRNGGESFDPVIRISDLPGDCIDDDNTVEGAVPCVLPDGTIVVVWAGPRGLEMDQSTDGGTTFGEDRVIGQLDGGWSSEIEGISRHNGMPVTGTDLSFGPHRGSLYVNFIDERNGHKDVFLLISRDGGATWLDPKRVNDDPVDNGRDQFFTWMSVDPVDGSINIAFYDRRETEGTQTQLTLARSVDGGETFTNLPIDFPAFDCSNPGMFFGDYLGIDALRGRVAIGFMHFENARKIAASCAVRDFVPGTCEPDPSPGPEEEPERVVVQHLLVAFEGTIPDKKEITRTREEAQALAASLMERAKGGEDFDAMVRDLTDDQHPGIYQMSNFWTKPDMAPEVTADKVFPRSMMVQSFGDVAFGLEVGEFGMAEYDADHSKYGWHIIKRIR